MVLGDIAASLPNILRPSASLADDFPAFAISRQPQRNRPYHRNRHRNLSHRKLKPPFSIGFALSTITHFIIYTLS
jgi:hypothetical protein